MSEPCTGGIRFVLFDFGGVLAEEGFLAAMEEISQDQNLNYQEVMEYAVELAYAGYVGGKSTEAQFWEALRQRFHLSLADQELRNLLLKNFVIRPWMLQIVDRLNDCGLTTVILSDQTNWLDELDARHGFYRRFHRVFNSWTTGFSKREPQGFLHALNALGAKSPQCLFIDDARRNIAVARSLGFNTIHFEYPDPRLFLQEMRRFCPCIEEILPKLWA